MKPEEKIISILKNPSLRGDLKDLSLKLIAHDYDLTKLVELARQEGLSSQLGYLSEVTAIALERKGIPQSKKLYILSEYLYSVNLNWQYLNPNIPDFAKRIFRCSAQTVLNKKWRMWGTITPEEIEDWISLYHSRSRYEPTKKVAISRQKGNPINY